MQHLAEKVMVDESVISVRQVVLHVRRKHSFRESTFASFLIFSAAHHTDFYFIMRARVHTQI